MTSCNLFFQILLMSHFVIQDLDYPEAPKLGDILDCVITAIKSVNHFYIQLLNEETIRRLEQVNSIAGELGGVDVTTASVGELVIYRERTSGDYCRAKVVPNNHQSLELVSVQLIDDMSVVENVPTSSLIPFCSRLTFAPLAHRASLYGIVPSPNDEEELNSIFSEYVADYAALKGIKGSLCTFFQKNGSCKFGAKCKDVHDVQKASQLVADVDLMSGTENEEKIELPDHVFDVEVTHFESPSLFYLRQKEGTVRDEVKQYLDQFQSVCKKKYNSREMLFLTESGEVCYPANGEIVAAFITRTGTWIRGKVLEYDIDEDQGKLFDIDSGQEGLCKVEYMRRLPQKCRFKPCVFRARLEVRPMEASEWSERAIELMRCSIKNCSRLVCSLQLVLLDGLHIVSLNTLEPSSDLADLLIDAGLADEYEAPLLSEDLSILPG
ncbi:uncharacterized protein LOC142354600 isoform X2 [Convolutriloba macropyga]|uniref:uncharacterized protein LOC142354600 isoform X2 n=1 Tax=Convolutriloba macropyga TaxID=536237 RepID=UPI003F51DFD1